LILAFEELTSPAQIADDLGPATAVDRYWRDCVNQGTYGRGAAVVGPIARGRLDWDDLRRLVPKAIESQDRQPKADARKEPSLWFTGYNIAGG